MSEITTLYDGLRFPEGSRWRDGRLWFSDMHTGEVFSTDPDAGEPLQVMAEIDDQPSGLGWLPDGSLLVSSMLRKHVVRFGADGAARVHADVSELTDAPVNDMVVDERGRAYLGGFGFDLYGGAPQRPGPIFRIDADGSTGVACDDMVFPNGCVILPGTRTLVVAETWAARLTAFEISEDGDLENKRVWAGLPEGATPDGICVDSELGIWVSDVTNGRFFRVTDAGAVTDMVEIGDRCATDCVLGGKDGRTLFLLTSNNWQPAETDVRAGRIEAIRVAVPGPSERG